MRDLIMLTDRPIACNDIATIIKNEFKSYQLLNDSFDLIYMKKKDSGFELELSPDDVLSDPECMMDDTVDKCPNKNAFLTNLSYSKLAVAKRIINLIKDLFGNMWIDVDEAEGWFGTAQEFIDSYEELPFKPLGTIL